MMHLVLLELQFLSSMKQNLLLSVLVSGLVAAPLNSTVDSPLIFRSGQEAVASQIGLIFIQGGDVPTSEYVDLVKSIGSHYPGSLFTIMPSFWLDHAFPFNIDLNPTIRILDHACAQLKKTMADAGVDEPAKIYIAGHSLGGIATQMFSQRSRRRTECPIAGTMVLGSTRQRQYDEPPAPFPVMTLTGFYDAQVKPMRSAESYAKWISSSDESQMLRTPVITLEDITHMGFATYGKPPKRVLETDMWPIVKIDDAHERIASVISDFLTVHSVSDEKILLQSKQNITDLVKQSGIMLKPYIDAMKLERSDHLKDPCSKMNNSEWCRSPLVELAQHLVLEASGIKSSLEIQDNHVKWTAKEIPSQAQIDTESCPSGSPCRISIMTSSKLAFSFRDRTFDTGSGYISADEIQMRLASPIAVAKALGAGNADIPKSICNKINEKMYKLGSNMVPQKYLTRFEKYGAKLVFGDDAPVRGPLSEIRWAGEKLQFRDSDISDQVQVISPVHVTDTTISCKILSPARVVEWIYLDGIRPKLGLNADFMRQQSSRNKIDLPWNTRENV